MFKSSLSEKQNESVDVGEMNLSELFTPLHVTNHMSLDQLTRLLWDQQAMFCCVCNTQAAAAAAVLQTRC